MYKLNSEVCKHTNKHTNHIHSISLYSTLSEGTKQTDAESLCWGKLSFEHEGLEWKETESSEKGSRRE